MVTGGQNLSTSHCHRNFEFELGRLGIAVDLDLLVGAKAAVTFARSSANRALSFAPSAFPDLRFSPKDLARTS